MLTNVPNLTNAEAQFHGFAHRFEKIDGQMVHITQAVYIFTINGEILRNGVEVVVSYAPMSREVVTYRLACDLALNLHESLYTPTRQLQWVDKFPWQQDPVLH